MNLTTANLRPEEIATLKLRGVFEEAGYKKYKMSKFEEYSLYAANKDFFGADKVITFTDLDGRLLALKPDVTLSIIKNTKATPDCGEKLYYIENVYRESKESRNYMEISQMGLEFLGDIGQPEVLEVLTLAGRTLKTISSEYVMELSHMDFALELLKTMNLPEPTYFRLVKLIRNKNADGICKVSELAGLNEEQKDALCKLTSLHGPVARTIKTAMKLAVNQEMKELLQSFSNLCEPLAEALGADKLQLDFSMVNDIDYYNGIIFKGYIKGLPSHVLAGGQYDRAMKIFGKNAGAIGFALYLNEVARLSEINGRNAVKEKKKDMITVALPKGRLGNQVYKIFAKAGYECPDFDDKNRKLILENKELGIRYLLVKPGDVAVYVEHNAADVGVVGKDILMETTPDVYELMDLGFGKCRMAVAAPKGYVEDTDKTLRIATKYVNIAKQYYMEKNRDIEIIKLNGSIELAPILGMSDVIVDIVETGNTLRENDLEVVEEFKLSSARLIANKSSFKFQSKAIGEMMNRLREAGNE